MKVISEERSTGMGATRYSAILMVNEFITVSKLDNVDYLGREAGIEKYQIEVSENQIWARFYRSNSGKETVWIFKGNEEIKPFNSFDMAYKWVALKEKLEQDLINDK